MALANGPWGLGRAVGLMTGKTVAQLLSESEAREHLREVLTGERATSDKLYAEKRVQTLVYGFCALALIAVIGGILSLVVK
jgi:hypothetical protein